MAPAWIVSNFPIIAGTASELLAADYAVTCLTWGEQIPASAPTPELVVLDITRVDDELILALLDSLPLHVRVVIMSLDWNEVVQYQTSETGLTRTGRLASLLDLRP